MTWYVMVFAVALFAWAFAEAFSWPIAPDVALASSVFLVPEAAVLLAVVTVGGSVIGGVTAMSAYRRGLRWPLPLVSDIMKSRVGRWLERGAVGLVNQPLTAVPYKAFVVEGARRGFVLFRWAALTAAFRGTRMLTVAIVTVLGSRLVVVLFPENVPQARFVVLAVGLVVFVVGWAVAWRVWATQAEEVKVRAGSSPLRTMRQ